MDYTNEEKRDCASREVRMRRRVYADRVAKGSMKHADAQREIALMEAIHADYDKAAKANPTPPGGLFS